MIANVIVSNDLLDRLIFLIIGMVIGLVLGLTHRAMIVYLQEVVDNLRDTKGKVDELIHIEKDERGIVRLRRFSLFIVVTLTAGAALVTGITNAQQRHDRETIKKTQDCFATTIDGVLDSLKERTSLSGGLAQADKEQNQSFANFLAFISKEPPPKPNLSRKKFLEYQHKLTAYNNLVGAQQKAQKENPFPSLVNYRDCLKEAKKGNN